MEFFVSLIYDYVNWNFLLSFLLKMGFREKWIGCIKWCISTIRFSVLVNDMLFEFFQSFRGLR